MASRLQVGRIFALLERMGAGRETLVEVNPMWEDYENQDAATADNIIHWLEGRRAEGSQPGSGA